MFQGRSGLPYFRRVSLVHTVYRSSESIKRPSISKRHARTGGGLGLVLAKDHDECYRRWTYWLVACDIVIDSCEKVTG
jgi:hypothetical protein